MQSQLRIRIKSAICRVIWLVIVVGLTGCAGSKKLRAPAEVSTEPDQPTQYNSKALTHFMNGDNYALQGVYVMTDK